MPLEYVLTGWSMNSPMSANAAIASKRWSISSADIRDGGVEVNVLAPGELRVESGSELEQRGDPAVAS